MRQLGEQLGDSWETVKGQLGEQLGDDTGIVWGIVLVVVWVLFGVLFGALFGSCQRVVRELVGDCLGVGWRGGWAAGLLQNPSLTLLAGGASPIATVVVEICPHRGVQRADSVQVPEACGRHDEGTARWVCLRGWWGGRSVGSE